MTEEDVLIRAVEEGKSESEMTWALWRLAHAHLYSEGYKATPEWPFVSDPHGKLYAGRM